MLERYKLLKEYAGPIDLKYMSYQELINLAEEVRDYILEVTAKNGGHVAPGLGVVELTIALLRVFDPPSDVIVWDIGHQAYPWKILTDRKEKFPTLRQYGGISGFLRREESVYDAFGAGHSSTSISAALGFRKAMDLLDQKGYVVAVIGDGAMTAGMAFEALNNAGHLRPNRFIVILNDNEMSISPNVGAISTYLSKILSGRFVQETRQRVKRLLEHISGVSRIAKLTEEFLKGLISPGIIFEELGFNYIGPVNGHDLQALERTLENIKSIEGPVLLHIYTKKGKGYKPAENDPVTWHGVAPYKRESGEFIKKPSPPTWTSIFGKAVVELAQMYPDLVVITPAMREGSGLVEFSQKFPERFFDVGIAEQHACTFAGGLAAQGLKPIAAYYSTFLQRAYDQVIHDIALQNLHVVFAIDRGGLVGDDGPTHHGVFDLSYLRCIPNMVVSAPKDEQELRDLLYTAINSHGPFAIRYPRGPAYGVPTEGFKEVPIGSWEMLVEGEDAVILAVGYTVYQALKASEMLKEEGIKVGVVNARFVKPMDDSMLAHLCKTYPVFITVEDNVIVGGFGAGVLEWLSQKGILKRVLTIGVPDRFIEHGNQNLLRSLVGIDGEGIANRVREFLRPLKSSELHIL
ncbi:deoxyxylulose-5-phosphate synthase [Hydrogenobacter thermophilus TK-6]|uniref:1-deoxy-D-xylulose-5-phosphate synthase n=1 Tax=Hydrogenobacter thermophilus (strain DSM 6534 / IAM 12695 / TK-6) TaxID=608538 RepID=D3DJ05_HYDTT|nr:1-deoxy-D-xylulose-5-phosphate synthase [Hydrogenobacter thermophilus]ADO45732.1 deoxyxylulose-5-phosphate synthase [Hydrogenobacter thermophilus TK-6]BAI69807.1 1-deoxy-D-xylulose-5-phosphate synthase [Hydrogenobacter thermophilus TK-6]